MYDFSDDWLSYDYDANVYLPYERGLEQKMQGFSLKIDLNEYPYAYLLIKTPKAGSTLFFGSVLKQKCQGSEWLVFSLDKLKKELDGHQTYLTIFSSAGPSETVAYIGFPSSGQLNSEEKKNTSESIMLLPRETSVFNSSIALFFLLSFLVMTFVSTNNNRLYKKYYSLTDIFSSQGKEDIFLIGKSLDRPSLMFIIWLSVLLSFIVLLVELNGFHFLHNSFLFQFGTTFGVHFVNFFKLAVLVFVAYMLKFFYVGTVAKLFNLGKVVDLHFFKVIQFSLAVYTLLLLVLLVMHNTYTPLPSNLWEIVFIGIIVFFTIRLFLIYFAINRESNGKFLFIFSYLCIVEVFPVMVFLNLFF